MTTRLYYTDAYRAEFSASIVELSGDGLRAYLDQTAFYPTSGGQQHDLGTLSGVPVVDVVDEDSRIVHVLGTPLAKTDSVAGVVDWARRYDHMQQHTGQHLVSAVFEDLFGFKTLSVHFGAGASTLDLDTESVTRAQMIAAESRANAIVGEARLVTVSFEESLGAGALRKASDRSGTLRIVTIEGTDRSACGGTHVRSTSEIGAVFLRGVDKVRKATRVEFVCGERAVRRARADFESLSAIAASLSASIDDAPGLVAAQSDRLKEAENLERRLDKELSGFRVRARYDQVTPDERGVRTIVIRDVASMDEVRELAQAAFALPKVVVVGALAAPPSVLLAASDDSGVDAGKLLKEKLAAVGGRGGGSPRLAQGSVPDAAAAESFVAAFTAPNA